MATYKLLEEFRNGAYGMCFKGLCKTLGCMRAVKQVRKTNTAEQTIVRNEATLLLKFDHPNILALAELVEDRSYLYFIVDLCEGGALSTYMQDGFHFTEVQTLVLMQQLLAAVGYLHHHERRICHRDLKLDNLLLSSKDPIETTNVLKLIDFRRCSKMDSSGFFRD